MKACSGLLLSVQCQVAKAFLHTIFPPWDLSLVLEGLLEATFEPMESASEKFLTLKTALHLAFVSLERQEI